MSSQHTQSHLLHEHWVQGDETGHLLWWRLLRRWTWSRWEERAFLQGSRRSSLVTELARSSPNGSVRLDWSTTIGARSTHCRVEKSESNGFDGLCWPEILN